MVFMFQKFGCIASSPPLCHACFTYHSASIYPILDSLDSVSSGALQAEEEERLKYDRKRQDLQILDEKGAETEKIIATEKEIRKLSTRISIAIQVVNAISGKISKLRDDELWPQTCELIQGYAALP